MATLRQVFIVFVLFAAFAWGALVAQGRQGLLPRPTEDSPIATPTLDSPIETPTRPTPTDGPLKPTSTGDPFTLRGTHAEGSSEAGGDGVMLVGSFDPERLCYLFARVLRVPFEQCMAALD